MKDRRASIKSTSTAGCLGTWLAPHCFVGKQTQGGLQRCRVRMEAVLVRLGPASQNGHAVFARRFAGEALSPGSGPRHRARRSEGAAGLHPSLAAGSLMGMSERGRCAGVCPLGSCFQSRQCWRPERSGGRLARWGQRSSWLSAKRNECTHNNESFHRRKNTTEIRTKKP